LLLVLFFRRHHVFPSPNGELSLAADCLPRVLLLGLVEIQRVPARLVACPRGASVHVTSSGWIGRMRQLRPPTSDAGPTSVCCSGGTRTSSGTSPPGTRRGRPSREATVPEMRKAPGMESNEISI